MRKGKAILFFLLISFSSAPAQQITARKILENVKEQYDRIRDYTVTLDIKPDIERFTTKEMTLTLYYKQPNKVHIESKGFVMIPRQLFESNPAELLLKFDPTLLETKKEAGRILYILRLLSKPEQNRPAMENYVTIDGTRWVILEMRAVPAFGRSIDITFDYALVGNEYLLPSVMHASFNFGTNDDPTAKMKGFKGMPTKGTVEIRYSNYVVNSGLSDTLFEKEEKQKERR